MDVPYATLRTDGQVFLAVYNGKLPSNHATFDEWKETDKLLWDICEGCWIKDPGGRPCTAQLLKALKYYEKKPGMHRIILDRYLAYEVDCRLKNSL